MSNVHGKEIPLQYVTVKVPGQKPRGSRTVPQTNPQVSGSNLDPTSNLTSNSAADQISFRSSDPLKKGEKVTDFNFISFKKRVFPFKHTLPVQ